MNNNNNNNNCQLQFCSDSDSMDAMVSKSEPLQPLQAVALSQSGNVPAARHCVDTGLRAAAGSPTALSRTEQPPRHGEVRHSHGLAALAGVPRRSVARAARSR